MKRFLLILASALVSNCLFEVVTHCQDFNVTPVPLTMPVVDFRFKMPFVALDVSEYPPSIRATYVGTTTFRFYSRPSSNFFLDVRWDLDASDGINFSAWYQHADPNVPRHDEFYATLRSLHNNEPEYGYTNGYPRRCQNFSISNANFNSDYPSHTTNTELAKISIFVESYFLIFALPQAEVWFNIYSQERDWWPGSTFPNDMRNLSFQRVLGGFWFLIGGNATARFQVYYNPSYTPTESALDWKDYSRTSNGSITGGSSWFDGTTTE